MSLVLQEWSFYKNCLHKIGGTLNVQENKNLEIYNKIHYLFKRNSEGNEVKITCVISIHQR